jgi:hypothetical protein
LILTMDWVAEGFTLVLLVAHRRTVHQEGGVEHPWPPRSGFG